MPACLLLIRRECIEDIGLLSERLFHLAEDVEYCVRAQQKGWTVDLSTDASVLHKGSSSLARFSPLYNYYEQRNRLFVVQQYRRKTTPISTIKDAVKIMTRLALTVTMTDRLANLPQGARFLLSAVYDFARGRDGKHENHPDHHSTPSVS
jgi:GT2 family glycosyltransferase